MGKFQGEFQLGIETEENYGHSFAAKGQDSWPASLKDLGTRNPRKKGHQGHRSADFTLWRSKTKSMSAVQNVMGIGRKMTVLGKENLEIL